MLSLPQWRGGVFSPSLDSGLPRGCFNEQKVEAVLLFQASALRAAGSLAL